MFFSGLPLSFKVQYIWIYGKNLQKHTEKYGKMLSRYKTIYDLKHKFTEKVEWKEPV